MRSWQFAAAIVCGITFAAHFARLALGVEPAKAAVGETKISWIDLPGVDGKRHALSDLESRDVIVVAVTCNHCPIAIEYYERMKDFSHKYCGPEGKVALVAVSLSHQETDRLPRMQEMARRQGFNFPYLCDESQQLGKKLGATNTPQFFVLDRDRVLAYRGAWDNNVNPSKADEHFIVDAVEALLAGKSPPKTETRALGCLIKYERR